MRMVTSFVILEQLAGYLDDFVMFEIAEEYSGGSTAGNWHRVDVVFLLEKRRDSEQTE